MIFYLEFQNEYFWKIKITKKFKTLNIKNKDIKINYKRKLRKSRDMKLFYYFSKLKQIFFISEL